MVEPELEDEGSLTVKEVLVAGTKTQDALPLARDAPGSDTPASYASGEQPADLPVEASRLKLYSSHKCYITQFLSSGLHYVE